MIAATERLGLRYHCKAEDSALLFATYTGDSESAKYLARLPHTHIDQTERMLQKLSNPESLAVTGKCLWIIDAHSEDDAVGLITVVGNSGTSTLHFGIGKPYRRRGYAVEASRLAANHLVNSGQADSVISFTDVDNLAAQAVLVKSGFTFVGRSKGGYLAPQIGNGYRDVFHYQFSPTKMPLTPSQPPP